MGGALTIFSGHASGGPPEAEKPVFVLNLCHQTVIHVALLPSIVPVKKPKQSPRTRGLLPSQYV